MNIIETGLWRPLITPGNPVRFLSRSTPSPSIGLPGCFGRRRARKAYLASIVDAVIVSEIKIMGSNDNIGQRSDPRANPRPWFVNLFRNGAQGRVVGHGLRVEQNQ